MTTYVPPKRATQFIFYVGLPSQSSAHTFQSNPTISSGDVKVSLDGGSLSNLNTLPTVTPASSKAVKVTLSASEMTADNVTVVFSDAAGAEWDDVIVNLQTSAQQIDDLSTVTAAGVWAYQPRTLTNPAVTSTSVTATRITEYRGTTWSIAFTDTGAVTGYSKLYFTVKARASDTDNDALVQIEIAGGLTRLNGAAYATSSDGSITVNDAASGDITIVLKPAASSRLEPATNLFFDVKSVISGVVTVHAAGVLNVVADVTRAVS